MLNSVVIRPSPFRTEVLRHEASPGQSIAEILAAVPDLPPEIWTRGVVRVGEWEIPSENWARVRPKLGRHMMHVGVRYGDRPQGGGKSAFATIAAIALVVAATAVSGGILGPGGALSISSTYFAAGSTSAALLAAGISVVGALALNALAPPPAAASSPQSRTAAELGNASIQGNVLEPFAPIPFVMGTHRVAPPHLILPWSESINDDQFVYAIVGLNGAHDFTDIRINGTPIDQLDDVEYEVRNVVDDDSDITLIGKQVYENQTGIQLSEHKVQDDATSKLQDVSTPADSYPIWATARTRSAPQEVWFTFIWTALVFQETSGGVTAAGIPVRIRIRRVGDTAWTNLPEFHVQRERLDPFRGTIKLRFEQAPGSFVRLDQDTTRPPWRYALFVDDADNDEGFAVDPYFEPATGNNALNVTGEDGVAVVYLDPALFPPGTYDVQVMRGYGYRRGDFASSVYKLSSQTPYFFTHTPDTSPPSIRQEQAKVAATMSWASMSSVWNEYPLGEKGLALIAVKAKNISISRLDALVSGYAYTPDTAGWVNFEPTANPAAWWRYLALGGQSNRAPYTASQLDGDSLEDWYSFCADNSHECNAYIDGTQSLIDILRIVGGTGRAVSRYSDKIGVVIERDRTADSPIQLFTQRNARGLSIRRAFPRIPDGFRVRFNDESNDYQPAEVFVYRRRLPGPATVVDGVTYVGITNHAKAVERANLDLSQLTRRAALYPLDADIESIYCTKGDLVALSYDTVARHYDAARVASVITSSGNVTGLTLDVPLRLSLIGEFGATESAGVVIQLKDGTTLTKEIDQSADTASITFADPFPIPAGSILEADCLVACGPFSSVAKRMLVLSVQPSSDMTASITLVDEAPPVPLFSVDGDALFFGADRAHAPF